MKLVFDTSVLSSFFSNNDQVVRKLTQHNYSKVIVPLATDAEIRFGFVYGNRAAENIRKYQRFIQQHNLEIVCPDQDTSIIYAELASWLRKSGLALSTNDIWIAATCIQSGGTLATFDKDFMNLPQILKLDLSNVK